MGKLEKEIEFYRDLFSKVFTLFLVVSGGTVAHFSQKGVDLLTAVGIPVSLILLCSVLVTGYLYKSKVNQLED
ncbi:hypothetical protein [Phorcysia thermohydrogeniphila]|uniref:Uncharacterized protein n=1 Tax=Phorcysia thermohydrogeniphila TaxID=936138 RepID=A0A4R1G922_9BACT|nr:hypothetical protein [Phorcysia thermohydrogeniphila]TCK04647.1 hypothetical protein CLV27_1080 [Phorcysia thermohydrogeniphila]